MSDEMCIRLSELIHNEFLKIKGIISPSHIDDVNKLTPYMKTLSINIREGANDIVKEYITNSGYLEIDNYISHSIKNLCKYSINEMVYIHVTKLGMNNFNDYSDSGNEFKNRMGELIRNTKLLIMRRGGINTKEELNKINELHNSLIESHINMINSFKAEI
jgi:chitinase